MRRNVEKKTSLRERFAALSRVGTALLAERDEGLLLQLIAQTACDLTGASFAAFSLRPLDENGQPLVESEGNLFHLAAVVGVNAKQEALLRQTPLGGEGLLAPIFRHGVSVRIDDFFEHYDRKDGKMPSHERIAARDLAASYARGEIGAKQLRASGMPPGHPLPRSFLGAPLLNLEGQVRGGLLLGHEQPGQFTVEDELLLVGLTSQAAVALENNRLARESMDKTQELQAIFESSVDGITLLSQEGRILRENQPASKLRQRLLQEERGAPMLEELLFAPARRASQTGAEQQQAVSLQLAEGEQQFVVTTTPLRATSTSLETRHPPTGCVVVWHDVTELRHLLLEQQRHIEIKQRQEFLQRILDELPTSAYLVVGPDARLVLANRAAEQVWGASWLQGELLEAFLQKHQIRILQVDGRPLPLESLATMRAVRSRATVHQYQQVIRHVDGTTLPVVVSAVPLELPGLEAIGGLGQEVDKPAVAALVVHQDISALKEAEHLKDEFISLAAHELRSPLAVLKGFAQTLLLQSSRKPEQELADWQKEALESIDQATARLVELVEDLLDVSRLQAGHFPLRPIPIDLVALTRRVVARVQPTSQSHQILLQSEADYLVCKLDPTRMEQVINNVLTNAIKYSPDGGVITIQLAHSHQGKMAQISVRDQGIGIPQEQQAQIFGRFARAENARLRGIGGTGLGLYLCRELVEQHHGRIWFQSQEDQGTIFYLTLPLLPSEGV